MIVRPEAEADADPIRALIAAAFADAPHSSGTEAAIVDALRAAGALTLSLVAEEGGRITGHVAFSPVVIGGDGGGDGGGWYGLGPVAVAPAMQKAGIGARLIRAGLDQLKSAGAAGCVVLGDPDYYRRFGFAVDAGITYPGVPPEYFQALAWAGPHPRGAVRYHPAFGAG